MSCASSSASPAEPARFRTGSEALARVQHPNIVQIHEVGELGVQLFFSLEFVAGGTLANKLRHEPQPGVRLAGRVLLVVGDDEAGTAFT